MCSENEMVESKKYLRELYDRAMVFGIKPVLNDIWVLYMHDDEIVLDYAQLSKSDRFSHIIAWKDSVVDVERLIVPDGIEKIAGGAFPHVHTPPEKILDLNCVKELPYSLFAGHLWMKELYGPNVIKLQNTTINYTSSLKSVYLTKLHISDLTSQHFIGVHADCHVVLADFDGTCKELIKEIRLNLFKNKLRIKHEKY